MIDDFPLLHGGRALNGMAVLRDIQSEAAG